MLSTKPGLSNLSSPFNFILGHNSLSSMCSIIESNNILFFLLISFAGPWTKYLFFLFQDSKHYFLSTKLYIAIIFCMSLTAVNFSLNYNGTSRNILLQEKRKRDISYAKSDKTETRTDYVRQPVAGIYRRFSRIDWIRIDVQKLPKNNRQKLSDFCDFCHFDLQNDLKI